MRAFIQKNESNHCANINFAIALDGFNKMGWEIIPFQSLDELSEFTKEDVFVGFVEETKNVFKMLNVVYDDVNCYPSELEKYLGRKIWKDTYLNFVKNNQFGYFIKPSIQNKLFTGKLINRIGDLVSIGHPKHDFEIYCSEPVTFISEARCFVRYGKILDFRRYKGSWKASFDLNVVEECISNYSGNLNGFAIDFGVTNNNQTLLVEVNEGYSLGAYGLFSVDYAKLLSARWFQLMNLDDPCNY
ncbi:MAG: ATP-grasp domain-containing protein [Saprospiraceae bacterium]|nr:ATP-grasp domain-containing protein [Saprospiraceae bacterium]